MSIRRRLEGLEESMGLPKQKLVLFRYQDGADWMDGKKLTPEEVEEILRQPGVLAIRIIREDRPEREE